MTISPVTEAVYQAVLARTASHDSALQRRPDWRSQVEAWAARKRNGWLAKLPLVAFFERAFESTHPKCFGRAWFGVRSTTASLLVGHIYLAAVVAQSVKSHGMWLLLDDDVMPHPDIEYHPVKSTKNSVYQLRWAHVKSMDVMGAIVENDALWESLSRASEKILHASIATDRDSEQRKRGKIRLADIWPDDGRVVPLPDNAASLARPPGTVGGAYRRADEDAAIANPDPVHVDPTKVDRGNRGHAATQNALADFLEANGLKPLSPELTDCDFDIAWERDDTFFVAEVKSTTDANEEKQLRLGIGQVLRYRQALSARRTKVVAVLVPERKPRDESWAQLCLELGVLLVWPGGFEPVMQAGTQSNPAAALSSNSPARRM